MTDNPYDVLGVATDAGYDTIKAAWRRRASATHPDREGGSTAAFQRVDAAWEVLKNPERRAHFDQYGTDPSQQDKKANLFSELMACVLRVLDEMPNAQYVDIKAGAMQFIESGIQNMGKERDKRIAALEKRRMAAGRFVMEDPLAVNTIREMLTHEVMKCEKSVAEVEGVIQQGHDMLAMLKTYTYVVDETQAQATAAFVQGLADKGFTIQFVNGGAG